MSPAHTHGVFAVPAEVDFSAAFEALGAGSDATELYHRFTPQGESWCRFGDRWRVVIHTWPEHGLATVDVYGPERVDLGVTLSPLGWVTDVRRRLSPVGTGEAT